MPAHMAIAVFKGGENEAMGSLMGLMTMAHSLGMLAGSTLAGLMMDLLQLRDAFWLGCGHQPGRNSDVLHVFRRKQVPKDETDIGHEPN